MTRVCDRAMMVTVPELGGGTWICDYLEDWYPNLYDKYCCWDVADGPGPIVTPSPCLLSYFIPFQPFLNVCRMVRSVLPSTLVNKYYGLSRFLLQNLAYKC